MLFDPISTVQSDKSFKKIWNLNSTKGLEESTKTRKKSQLSNLQIFQRDFQVLLKDVTPDCLQISQDCGHWSSRPRVNVKLPSDYRPVDIIAVRWIYIKSLQKEQRKVKKT